jgi:tetratricopeptide (TPR) repeat protein
MQNFESARRAFHEGEYAQALAFVDKSLAAMPKDAALHEFRALVLFAQKEYKQSAATIYAVLAVGPGWDWTTLVRLYPHVDVYTAHLRALEAYCSANPDSADAGFLLAYHYLTAGHNDAARTELEAMLKLVPGDTVATGLLQTLAPAAPDAEGTAAPADPRASQTPAAKGELPELNGVWQAERPDGAEFTLTFDGGKNFVWKYAHKDRGNEVDGTYTLGANTLLLEAADGNTLVGRIVPEARGFRLTLMGGPSGDPGLYFKKRE